MARITWSAQAVSDLQDIHRFIARDSLAAASLTVERIRDSVFRLASFPGMGRPLPEDPHSDVKELISPPFRVMYTTAPDEVRILTVLHGARKVLPDDFGTEPKIG